MTTTTHHRVPSTSVLAWTAGIAAVWVIAAFLRADTTLHLGPLLLPLVPALVGRDAENPIGLTLIGIGAGAVAIVVLFTSGHLEGPALDPFNSALTESLVLLAVGSVIGLVIAALSGRRSR